MLYQIVLRNAEFNLIHEIAEQNGFDNKLFEIFTCRDEVGDIVTFFKCDKETLEKIMYFMPDGHLKRKLQQKIDFWVYSGMW